MITVGIPVYNQGEFLADAIESVLNQTVPCELIVVNDGSLDRSLEVANMYAAKGVKVINQVNKGLSSARNTAIMNMQGDYFLPLDADDMLLEHCVEKMEAAIKKFHPDVVASSFKQFGVANEEVLLTQVPTLADFKQANRIGYFSAIKKEALLEVGGYSPRMTWGYEDYHLWFDLFKRGKNLCVISDILMLYRTKEISMLTEANKHSEELLTQIMKDHAPVFA